MSREEREALFKTMMEAAADAQAPPANPPDRLYHYTTLDALQSIIDQCAFRASDARYLNDASELSYASNLIEEVLDECLNQKPGVKEVLPDLRDFSIGEERSPYVACFCEEKDLLSQWRGYGRDQAGHALGLDLVGLGTHMRDLPSGTHLRKVVYEPEVQRARIRETVEPLLEVLAGLVETHDLTADRSLASTGAMSIRYALADDRLTFKDPGFSEEREWRLIKLVDSQGEGRRRFMEEAAEAMRDAEVQGGRMPNPEEFGEGIEIKYRSAPIGLIPYVELSLRLEAGALRGRLPLREVVQGPTLEPELSLDSLRAYLASNGYPEIFTDSVASRIPLRAS